MAARRGCGGGEGREPHDGRVHAAVDAAARAAVSSLQNCAAALSATAPPSTMRYLVADTGPIIKGHRLDQLGATTVVTLPEVVDEVRDERARQLLATMDVQFREPSDESIAAVRAFAKLTGDLPVLSAVDLRVLALTWMLEKECRGVAHLRTEPPPRGAPPPRAAAADDDMADVGGVDAITAAAADVEMAADGDADAGEDDDEEVEEVLDDVPHRVSTGLYVGSLDAATNLGALRERGITHLLTAAAELSQPWPEEFTRLHVSVRDDESEDLTPHFDKCSDFIDGARKGGGGVLVHCLAGASRSVAVVCAYMMRSAEPPGALSAADALRHVQEARPWANPNPAFRRQLEAYGRRLAGGGAAAEAAPVAPSSSSWAAVAAAPGRRRRRRRRWSRRRRRPQQHAPPKPSARTRRSRRPPAGGGGGGGGGGRQQRRSAAGGGADEEDDGIPWITPSNLKAAQAADARYC